MTAPERVDAPGTGLRYGTPQARWVIAGAALGSGIAFLDATVVNVALPAIGSDLHASLSGLQWTVNAYLVTLSALLLLGGTLGDRFGRRQVFVIGLGWFALASALCGVAPSSGLLIVARSVQGVGGALLVPGSLAILSATFHPDDRGQAIGAWAGLAGVASSLGPFLGGWLIDAVSWRLIFLINLPLAAAAIVISLRSIPETRSVGTTRIDAAGALAATVAVAGLSFAAIEHRGGGSVVAAAIGLAGLGAFVLVERRSSHPMLPLGLFRSRQFSGSNVATFAVYAALSGAFFLVVLRLQESAGYSPLAAGAALSPFTALMLVLSPLAGRVGQRLGPRIPMTVGPLVAAVGLLLFSTISPHSHYLAGVLPGVLMLGLGMAITVAPLTAAVLVSVPDELAGVASGVNNAVARLAGLVAVATLPALVGIGADASIQSSLDPGYGRALWICAAVSVVGGVIAAVLVRDGRPVRTAIQASAFAACQPAELCR
jgi:EmrB/QacA subfamily drug resistance transporter